jgi:hypothetical protein
MTEDRAEEDGVAQGQHRGQRHAPGEAQNKTNSAFFPFGLPLIMYSILHIFYFNVSA